MTDCPWDLNGDGVVDDADQIWLMDHWGPCVPGSKGDFNGDGTIDISDIVILQEHYGPCPGVTPPPSEITCNGTTPHYSSGCALLLHYGAIGGGVYEPVDHSIISRDERNIAVNDQRSGLLTDEEYNFVVAAEAAGSINALCPGCYTATTPPPNMETRTVSLTEGSHTIQVSFTGYDTLNATINVSSTGVTCVSVIGGACGGSSLPRVSTSGWTVTTYLKSGAVTTNRCTWIATKDTSKVAFISEMVLAYNNLANIGFIPSASEIGDGVLMYANLGTPASLWGC